MLIFCATLPYFTCCSTLLQQLLTGEQLGTQPGLQGTLAVAPNGWRQGVGSGGGVLKKECHSFTLTGHTYTARMGILTGDLLTAGHTEWPLTV